MALATSYGDQEHSIAEVVSSALLAATRQLCSARTVERGHHSPHRNAMGVDLFTPDPALVYLGGSRGWLATSAVPEGRAS